MEIDDFFVQEKVLAKQLFIHHIPNLDHADQTPVFNSFCISQKANSM